MIRKHSFTRFLLLFTAVALAAGYDIEWNNDGPFAFSISDVTINEGSTMQRESILFNDPSSLVKLKSHSTEVIYKDRGFRFMGKSRIVTTQPIVAIQVLTIQYRVLESI